MPRLTVPKTYKLYIGGKFPRTESGRSLAITNAKGDIAAHICHGSRKDLRDAVEAASKASEGWSDTTCYLRSQIMYRMAEMLEGRRDQFINELMIQGSTNKEAEQELKQSIDRLIYYAGWTDKYQQIFSSVNPVSSAHYNFSVPEYQGVIALIAPVNNHLLGLISLIAPALVGGNTVVCLASEKLPLSAISLGEVLHGSDVPNGVVNILTGFELELAEHFSSHKDVNGVVYCGDNLALAKSIQENASENVKRVHYYDKIDWLKGNGQSPYFIIDHSEIKTTWHPIGS